MNITEDSIVEQPTIQLLQDLGYDYLYWPSISPGWENPMRESWNDVILKPILLDRLKTFNPFLDDDWLEEIYRILHNFKNSDEKVNNKDFYKYLIEWIPYEYRDSKWEKITDFVRLIDFENPENNDWKVVNQLTITSWNYKRRPDVIVYLNGFPFVIFELKNPSWMDISIYDAYEQLREYYQNEIKELFYYNQFLVISDMHNAKLWTLTADYDRFSPWKYINFEKEVISDSFSALEVLIKWVFHKNRFLDLIKNFIVYETDWAKVIKKLAMYHQYYWVNNAIRNSLDAITSWNRKAWVIWHTQWSGKSLSMIFFANKLQRTPELWTSTLIFLTDRNDLDNQLYENFLNTFPYAKQAEDKENLKELLQTKKWDIIFTTIQKFWTEWWEDYGIVSERNDIIVIADEAHRSQYRNLAWNVRQALPNASFLWFTWTPIDLNDKSTTWTFGDYASVYNITDAVDDWATVKIYYEWRMVPLWLKNELIDFEFDEVTENEEIETREKLKSQWSALEKVIWEENRLKKIASDIVEHFNKRNEQVQWKWMIVCMSRDIAVRMHEYISSCPNAPKTTVVISWNKGKDPQSYHQFIRTSKQEKKSIEKEYKDPNSDLKLVIVRDMWLTWFDAPCVHTMYVDKPMKDHSLMQAIARVNRVFKNKPWWLIVDYIWIAYNLKKSLSIYTREIRETAMIDIEQAVKLMSEKYEKVSSFFQWIDFENWKSLSEIELSRLMAKSLNIIVKNDATKQEFLKTMNELKRIFDLVMPHSQATKIRNSVYFLEKLKQSVSKFDETGKSYKKPDKNIQILIGKIIDESLGVGDVVDLFEKTWQEKPDISILSDDFLDKVEQLEYKNLAIEMLEKVINNEITSKMSKNAIKVKSFKEMIKKVLDNYNNNLISTVDVIKKLVEIAKDVRNEIQQKKDNWLSEEEEIFYDALLSCPDCIKDKNEIKKIVKEIVKVVKETLVIDWHNNEKVKAKIRVIVKNILRKHWLNLELREQLIDLIMFQAENYFV